MVHQIWNNVCLSWRCCHFWFYPPTQRFLFQVSMPIYFLYIIWSIGIPFIHKYCDVSKILCGVTWHRTTPQCKCHWHYSDIHDILSELHTLICCQFAGPSYTCVSVPSYSRCGNCPFVHLSDFLLRFSLRGYDVPCS